MKGVTGVEGGEGKAQAATRGTRGKEGGERYLLKVTCRSLPSTSSYTCRMNCRRRGKRDKEER